MARCGRRAGPPAPARPPVHPSLVQIELGGWAGERIARGGRGDALLGRVEMLRVSLDGGAIEARVRGNRPLPYQVQVRVDDGRPVARCTCSREAPTPCRHAVAALEALRFPLPSAAGGARSDRRPRKGRGRIIQRAPAEPGFLVIGDGKRSLTREERIAAALEEELAVRRRQARRSRAKVQPLADGGGPPRYEVLPRRTAPSGIVTLRGPEAELAHCSCTDFAENELGSCEHVERVRVWRRRLRKRDRQAAPANLLSLWCRPRVWTDRAPDPLLELRVDLPRNGSATSLGRYFDDAGWLRPAPEDRAPSVWARAAREAARRVARRSDWTFEVDDAVGRRIREAAAAERLASRRGDERIRKAWEDVVGQLGFRLHPYQEVGVEFLWRAGRAFLADDMGLGKTIQAIAAALVLRRSLGARRAMVVCPASLKHQWSREIRKACGERAQVVEGPPARRFAIYSGWREGFLILNYELVLRDLDAVLATRPDLVVLDEAQRIKNWNTKTARAVKRLQSPHAFILTGTPLENRLNELHSLVEFLHPRAPGPRWRLLPFHAVSDDRGQVIAYEGLQVLRRRLEGFFLRRERRAVLDQLPERTENTFWIGMTGAQLRPYRKHAATAARLASKRNALAAREVRALLRALTSMRILCNAHAQYDWEHHAPLLREAPPETTADLRALHSPKLEEFARVLEDLLEQSEEKLVVFSQWERMLRLAHFAVRAPLDRRDLRGDVFHGGLRGHEREEVLRAFRTDPEFRVLFSTDAGGLGLNLQDAASIVVNLEVPWNPAVLEQRVGRVHRIGQRKSVQVLHFITRGAIEERVRQVVESKRALFDGLFVDDANEVVFDDETASSFLERVRGLIG